MCARPTRQEGARSEAIARYRNELRSREARGVQRRPSVESAPRGNQATDHGEVERGFEKLWSVVGR